MKAPSGFPAFIYHGFYRSEAEVSSRVPAEQRYFLPVRQFQSHLDYLSQHEFRAYSLEGYLKEKRSARGKELVLTFDDGNGSDYAFVWPMLRERGFAATFFIVADWVGQPGRVTCEQLRKMVQGGMSIGSHGLSHSPLTRLPLSQLDTELASSKDKLEQMLGVKIRHLAVPGGFVNPLVLERARMAGYECVCTSVPALSKPEFAVNRLSITRLTNLETFARLANRDRTQLSKWWVRHRVLQGAKQLVGVENYELTSQKLLHYWRSNGKESGAIGEA